MTQGLATHVVKIGGSLLERDDFVPALRQWIAGERRDNPNVHLVLIVGGGGLVDALREMDNDRPSDQSRVHWLAIELMEVTGRLVAGWFPEWPVEVSLERLTACVRNPGVTQFLPRGFLRNEEPLLPGGPLPAGWQVTSDSIAARVAVALQSQRLTLLKRRNPAGKDPIEWAAQGYVDAYFPWATANLGNVSAQELPTPPLSPAGNAAESAEDGELPGDRNVKP